MLAVEAGAIDIVRLLVEDPRTWLCAQDENGEDAFCQAAHPEVSEMLNAALETRWRQDIEMTTDKVSAWSRVRACLDSGLSRCDVSSVLKDFGLVVTRLLVLVFEERGVTGWVNASAEDWALAESELENDFMYHLKDNYFRCDECDNVLLIW